MNKLCCLIIMFFTCAFCKAQNLVPNGSFEVISSCPTGQNQLSLASPWVIPANTGSASPDLFNSCNTTGFGVPVNVDGYQNAHSGVGYAGFYTYGGDCREYIQVQLTTPLTSGITYRAEMYVNPGEITGIAVDAIGIYISTGPISGTGTYLPLPYVPQISNPTNNIITDTLGWTQVTGLYTAVGGENYITVGSFLNDSSTNYIIFNPSGYDRGYYRVDDVSVSDATAINELDGQEVINIYPNPFYDKINIQMRYQIPFEFFMYDITSRIILQQSSSNSISINTDQLAKGIYIYEVRNKIGVIKKGKIVKD